MNTNPYPIYVINLKRNPERKLHIQRQLDTLNLSYRFVDAVDKYDMQSPAYRAEIARLLDIDQTIITHQYIPDFYDHLTCSLSHIKAYNLMRKNNDQAACILEDDAVISPDFHKILHAIQKVPWDIVQFSSHSRTTRHILGTNPNIQKKLETFPDIDCSLFPRLRKIKWYKRLLPLTAISKSQLDCTLISKLEWCLLVLLSHSPTSNALFKYFINAYILLLKLYNPDHHLIYKNKKEYKRGYSACNMGGLPIRSSQQTIYGNYDIATPIEEPTSGMGYLLTSSAMDKLKNLFNSDISLPIDFIFWQVHKKYRTRLRIITPPCVRASLTYLEYSARNPWD